MKGIVIGTMLICLRMGRVYTTKRHETLADPIIIGGHIIMGRYIIRLRTFFDIHSSLHIRGLHIAARSTEFYDAGLEGKDEGALAECENRAVA